MPKFNLYGHQIFPKGTFEDVVFALVGLVMLIRFLRAQKIPDKLFQWFFGILFFVYLPNATYLFVEIKHVLFVDNVADQLEPDAVKMFTTLSALGLIVAVTEIYVAATQINFLKTHTTIAIALLSIASAWGTILGLKELQSSDGLLFPPLVLIYSLDASKSVDNLLLCLGLSTILIGFTLLLKLAVDTYSELKQKITQQVNT